MVHLSFSRELLRFGQSLFPQGCNDEKKDWSVSQKVDFASKGPFDLAQTHILEQAILVLVQKNFVLLDSFFEICKL